MKFNCGPSREEKRLVEVEYLKKEARRITEWHDCFAWFPIRVGDRDCRWLETVEAKAGWAEVTEGSLYSEPRLWHGDWKYRAK